MAASDGASYRLISWRSASTPSSSDLAEKFRAFLATKREASADVEAAVRGIIADVIARGDRALAELTQKFDSLDFDRVPRFVYRAE